MFLENPKVTRCQKCQKPSEHPFGTFGTPSVSVFSKFITASFKERGGRHAIPNRPAIWASSHLYSRVVVG
jgi:hypothetical protein